MSNNFQPTTKSVIVNDKFSKKLFQFDEKMYHNFLMSSEPSLLIEGRKKIKGKWTEFKSPFKISLVGNYPAVGFFLDHFDRAVFTACVSEYENGNKDISVGVIYRHITGKASGSTQTPTPQIKSSILESVQKLRSLKISINMKSICDAYNYRLKHTTVEGVILPCTLQEKKLRGQSATLIQMTAESPLLTIARAKGQILTIERQLLDTANSHNSRAVISTKFYSLIRVVETLGIQKLTPTITFDDVFEKCHLSDATRKTKMFCRNSIVTLFVNLKNAGLISDFELVKKDGAFSYFEFKKSSLKK